jgi:prepilin-type N-terminal cleavage/methylation domain-containing protein
MPVRRRGFTLIELLVVIAIIAILAAILFPVFLSARKRAQTATCLSNLKQLSQAMRDYADDHQGFMPYDWPPSSTCTLPNVPNWCGSVAANEWVYPERGQLWNYVRNRRIYECPLDIGRKADLILATACPSGLSTKDYPLSYSMNHSLANKQVDTFTNASRRMLLIHENRGVVGDYNTNFAINDGTFVPGGQDVPGSVHYNGTTLSYLDMHAVWKSRNALLAERNAPNTW